MADRVITPPGQRHYIEPFDQRVFQFDTDKSDVFLSRVANSVYQVLGDDIVMYGLDALNPVHTSDSVQLEITKGAAIQDQTLIVTPDNLQLEITGVSGMDESGRIVVMSNYNYLETFEQNRHTFNINYINSSGSPLHSFLPQRDRIVLAILQFTKDASDNVTSVSFASDPFITISGKQYFIKGYSESNKRLTSYLIHQLLSGANTSVELDPSVGLRLIGDQQLPGNLKFYGTNQTGSKGWFDISTLGVDNESDIQEYQSLYNQVLFNGNLFFIKDGHSINYELYPFWQFFDSDQIWSAVDPSVTYNSTEGWLSPVTIMKFNVKSGTPWSYGYRPLKFKVGNFNIYETGTPPAMVDRITVFDVANNIIGEKISSFYPKDTELLLDFSNDMNIGSFEIETSVSAIYQVGQIQFFGGTPGGVL
jgi:hypothetical protein